ncbi:DUF1778 domain-containing protein [Methylocapsa acidiphila]|uniref:type II toxin-antitoxin system TacA family antitoxin n=1 Tax=Methylocapsa acidiphila TaxID=133552 RepID=UPI000A022350|nr:DUF1778 domain-containing protein [Methylocapsa acidiphila]
MARIGYPLLPVNPLARYKTDINGYQETAAHTEGAVSLRGRSRTDFVREAAVPAAEEVLMENTPIRMTHGDFDAFMAALSGPAMPVPEVVEIIKRPAPWEEAGSRK